MYAVTRNSSLNKAMHHVHWWEDKIVKIKISAN